VGCLTLLLFVELHSWQHLLPPPRTSQVTTQGLPLRMLKRVYKPNFRLQCRLHRPAPDPGHRSPPPYPGAALQMLDHRRLAPQSFLGAHKELFCDGHHIASAAAALASLVYTREDSMARLVRAARW